MSAPAAWFRALIAAASVVLVAGCASDSSGTAAGAVPTSSAGSSSAASSTAPPAGGAGSAALPKPDHVVVVIFENKNVDRVQGAPFLTSLAARGAAFTDAHGERHPSEPNYLALFSGSTQGVTSDACPLSFPGGGLAGQLQAAGRTFVGYSEGLPSVGYTGCSSGKYARKHNPWVNFPALPASVNQPLSAMPKDFAALPTVSFVVPDLCNDMHDCPVSTGDTWAREHLAAYADWATAHNSLLIVTFDEDEGTAANHIATTVVGAGVTAGPSSQRIDHYSLLRTLEDMYGLPPLGSAADATPLTGIWSR